MVSIGNRMVSRVIWIKHARAGSFKEHQNSTSPKDRQLLFKFFEKLA
jgi:hypothetical protein